MQNEKIIQAINDIFNGADERDWQKVQNAMAETVLLDYSSLSGNPAATIASSQIIETWKDFLPGFDKTHHQLSDFQVTGNDNTAIIHFNGKADHFISKDVWTVEGSYEAAVSKAKDVWTVTKLKFNFSKQSGNTNLPATAIQNLNKH